MDKQSKFTKSLHWTTIASEKLLLAIIGIATCIASAMYIFDMVLAQEITLPDLFMLFIYVEIIGMVGAFTAPIEFQSPCQSLLRLQLFAD